MALNSFGARLRHYRKAAGYSAEQFAQLCNEHSQKPTTTRNVIAQIESGRKKEITLNESMQYSQMLGIPLAALAVDLSQPFHMADMPAFYNQTNYEAGTYLGTATAFLKSELPQEIVDYSTLYGNISFALTELTTIQTALNRVDPKKTIDYVGFFMRADYEHALSMANATLESFSQLHADTDLTQSDQSYRIILPLFDHFFRYDDLAHRIEQWYLQDPSRIGPEEQCHQLADMFSSQHVSDVKNAILQAGEPVLIKYPYLYQAIVAAQWNPNSRVSTDLTQLQAWNA